jgi:hypothetical protein
LGGSKDLGASTAFSTPTIIFIDPATTASRIVVDNTDPYNAGTKPYFKFRQLPNANHQLQVRDIVVYYRVLEF